MKKFIGFLTGVAFVAMGLLPIAAHATVDMDTNTGAPTFASELINAAPATTDLANSATSLQAQVKVGATIPKNVSAGLYFVQFDLTTAKFKVNPTLTLANATATLLNSAAGTSTALFGISTAGSAVDVDPATPVVLNCTAYTVSDTTAVTIAYTLKAPSISANPLVSVSGKDFIKYAAGAAVAKDDFTGKTKVIDVIADSKKFVGGGLVTPIGNVSVVLGTALSPATGLPVVITDLAGAAVLTVTGDFTAAGSVAGSVFLDKASNTCANTSGANVVAATLDATSKTATFAVGPVTIPAGGASLCYKVTGTLPIMAGTYDAKYVSGGKITEKTFAAIGTLDTNAEALQSPWFQYTTTGVRNRFILTNMAAAPVDYTVTVFTTEGVTVELKNGGKGTLAAGQVKQVNIQDLVKLTPPAGSTKTIHSSVVFNFLGAAANVQAVYQNLNPTTGQFINTPMLRPYSGN